jgi:SAM-dependent methyltransferase
MSRDRILSRVDRYYSGKVAAHGPTPRGVDWNSAESQELRFAQLVKVCGGRGPFSLNDIGCGYGALLEYLRRHQYRCEYRGYDISAAMIDEALAGVGAGTDGEFFSDPARLRIADYTVASGIFNVRLDEPVPDWERYVLETLDQLHGLSGKGFSFNVLTSYSDPERMRPDLYYPDPCRLFDHCKRRYSRHVALLHDYGLYEFTLLVRRAPVEAGG